MQQFQYTKYIKLQVFLCIVPWVIPLVHLLMKMPSEPFIWEFVLFAVIFEIAFPGVMYVARRLHIGLLTMRELDFQTVYELDKRPEKPKNQKHNLILWLNLCFYGGYVQETKEACEKLLALHLKPDDVYDIQFTKIILDFLCGNIEDMEDAIAQHKQLAAQKKIKADKRDAFHCFIQLYLQGQYSEAIEAVKELLNDEIIKINNAKKMIVFTLMHMAYEKLDDIEQMQMCKANILQADPHFRTVFSRRFLGE